MVDGQWDNRFPEIELTALNEMNAIIATCGKKLRADNLDKRLLKNLPVDVRVILTWDADNTDMDLWVTDPNGEKCFYSHRNTQIGGYVTGLHWVTDPRNFFSNELSPVNISCSKLLREPPTNHFGATTVQLEMTTDFGKPNAKTEAVTLRLQVPRKSSRWANSSFPEKRINKVL